MRGSDTPYYNKQGINKNKELVGYLSFLLNIKNSLVCGLAMVAYGEEMSLCEEHNGEVHAGEITAL